jgi:hypothetical protein
MRHLLFSVLVFLPGLAWAAPDHDALRDLARAGDVAGLEQAFADAFAAFRAGALRAVDLRSMVEAVVVTDPAVRDGIGKWHSERPGSAFAASVAAFRDYEDSFALRGEDTVSDTHPSALAAFSKLQDRAMEHALDAYAAEAGFPPATDAVMIFQRTTHKLSPSLFDSVVAAAMAAVPERDTLWRATLQAEPQWGGGGLPEVERLCDLYAGSVTDVANYDVETCVLDNLSRGSFPSEIIRAIIPQIDANPNPVLDHARLELLMYDSDPAELAAMRAMFNDPAMTDIDLARSYDMLRMSQGVTDDPSMVAIVAERAFNHAREALAYDPYNRDLLSKILYAARADNYAPDRLTPDERLAFSRDLVVAMPLNGGSWGGLASEMSRAYRDDPLETYVDPIYINSLAYSKHQSSLLSNFAYDKLVRLEDIEDQTRSGAAAPPIETLAERLSCPLVRILRLIEAVCATPDDFTICGPVEGEAGRFNAAVAPAVDAGFCAWERWGPVSLLVFEPVEVDVGTLRLRP